VGVGLRWVARFKAGGKGRTTRHGALVNHQRNSNQLNIGPGLINSTEEKLIKQPTHSIEG
jgi:hypothetical protein